VAAGLTVADPFHNFAGARLPTSPSPAPAPDDIGDPAKGEKVPRCLTCGTPTRPITGTFVPDRGQLFGGRRFRYRLCVHCIAHANGPQPPDPLQVDEDAA
jgi:hypothetical protein